MQALRGAVWRSSGKSLLLPVQSCLIRAILKDAGIPTAVFGHRAVELTAPWSGWISGRL